MKFHGNSTSVSNADTCRQTDCAKAPTNISLLMLTLHVCVCVCERDDVFLTFRKTLLFLSLRLTHEIITINFSIYKFIGLKNITVISVPQYLFCFEAIKSSPIPFEHRTAFGMFLKNARKESHCCINSKETNRPFT